jgi:ribosomal protein L37AE/L43A
LNVLYCPNCSAYQKSPNAANCHKCGYDFAIEDERRRKRAQEVEQEEIRKFTESNRTFDPAVPCKVCGEPTMDENTEVDHQVEGKRISIGGLKMMGADVTKRTVTTISITVTGRICQNGHKMYSSFDAREKPLCPMCLDRLIRYGSSIFSCPRCKRHFPLDAFATMDPEQALREEGWVRI